MTIVRVGTNQKYASGWESVFGKGGGKKKPASEPAAKHAVGTTKGAPPKPIKSKTAAKPVKKKAPSKKAKGK